MHRAEVYAEHAPRTRRGNDFQERVSRDPRLVPLRVRHRLPAYERERLGATGAEQREPGDGGDPVPPSATPAAWGIRCTASGSRASCRSTRSGWALRIAAAIASSRPRPPWRML